MCGLAGAFAFADAATDELVTPVRAMSELIVRRGPDDHGIWTDGRRCALGFRRLSILDLSPTGHQPMVTPDGRYALIFNGEIYNYRDLRADLLATGDTLRSTGDAETLLHLLARKGPVALESLEGMFALALYDAQQRLLYLARDHAGIKPLYYAKTPKGIVFGSQYDQLLEHPWMQGTRFSNAGRAMYLRFGFLPAAYGLHDGARQVDAGECLEVRESGKLVRHRFFAPSTWEQPTLRGEAALDAFDAAFSRAVRRHLIADVPVGVLLSGGIDSPLVAAEARSQHGEGLKAFTIAMTDPELDETEDASAYAAELGLDHYVETATPDSGLSMIDDVVSACTEPTADHSIFPTLMVSRLAKSHVKVVLSGDGGDELFWGYPSRFGSAIEHARYMTWPKPARAAAIVARRTLGVGTATRDVLRFSTVGSFYRKKHTLLDERTLATIFPQLPEVPDDFNDFDFDGVDPDRVAQWVRWNEFRFHLARVLAKVDRASMFHSLEVRVPLLDRKVIEVAWRTDWRSCLSLDKRVGKRVLRHAVARRLRHPTAGKRGFTVPMHRWLAGPLAPLVREYLLEARELVGLEVSRHQLAMMYRRLIEGDSTVAWGLWSLLSLAMWSRRYLRAGA
jgi:asparagine synthase (glutamine-hydrolysing)